MFQDILHTRVRTSGIVEVKLKSRHISKNIYQFCSFELFNKPLDSGEIPHQGHDLPDPRRGRAEVREAQMALPL